MLNVAIQDDVIGRVSNTRIARCSGSTWVKPPRVWPSIVQKAWPSQWHLAPHGLPDGWIDILLAMCAHVAEVDPAAKFVTVYQDTESGALDMRVSFTVEDVAAITSTYTWISRSTCTVCGRGVGKKREITVSSGEGWSQKLVYIRCDAHAVL